jgi:hypothetical protein
MEARDESGTCAPPGMATGIWRMATTLSRKSRASRTLIGIALAALDRVADGVAADGGLDDLVDVVDAQVVAGDGLRSGTMSR